MSSIVSNWMGLGTRITTMNPEGNNNGRPSWQAELEMEMLNYSVLSFLSAVLFRYETIKNVNLNMESANKCNKISKTFSHFPAFFRRLLWHGIQSTAKVVWS